MKQALLEAEYALEKDEVPIGAVIVINNQIISRAHNLVETLNDFTAHAEIQAFTAASNFLGDKYLNECTLYTTLEPCIMCAGASQLTRLGKIIYGAKDLQKGYSSIKDPILHPKTIVQGGVLENECSGILKQFFRTKRSRNLN